MTAVFYLLATAGAVYLNLGLAVYTWRHRERRGALALCIGLLLTAWLSLMFFLKTLTPDPDLAFVWVRLRFIGVSLLPVAWIVFTLQYTGMGHWLTPLRWGLLLIVPTITQFVLWLRPEWFFATWELVRVGGYSLEDHQFTGWFSVHVIYGVSLLVAVVVLMLRHIRREAPHKRYAVAFIVISICMSVILSLLPSPIGPAPGFRLTPLGTGLMGIAFFLSVFWSRLLDLMPVAGRTVLDSMDALVAVVDTDDRVVYLNPQGVRDANKAIGSPYGKPIEQVFPMCAANIDFYRNQERVNAQFASQAEDERIVNLSITPLRRNNGRVVGRVFVVRDVTEQVKLMLEQERSRLMKAFIENTHHEFRTLLSSIQNSVYFVRQGSRADDRLVRIEQNVEEMTTLIDKMLEVIEVDNASHFQMQPLNLNDIVREAVDAVMAKAVEKQQYINLRLADDLPVVMGDETGLYRALKRIIHNAIRFTGEEGQIRIVTRGEAGRVYAAVTDDGVGMDAATREHIFKRFYRADTERSTPGFGLGLPIAQAIVSQHGGHIDVHSTPGKGSTFEMMLPAVSELAPEVEALPRPLK